MVVLYRTWQASDGSGFTCGAEDDVRPEMKELAEDEVRAALPELEAELQKLLLLKDVNDERNVFSKFIPAQRRRIGCSLAISFRMYAFAERQRWRKSRSFLR